MYVEVVATLTALVRRGERFTLRPRPLRVGSSREARVRLGEPRPDAVDLELRDDGGPEVRVPAGGPRASLDGVELPGPSTRPLADGDCLYVHPGLALVALERPRVQVRDAALEATLAARDDDASWGVYRDLLEERGDELSDWLRRFPVADELARRGRLGPLADAAAGGVLQASWGRFGFLESVVLSRQAVLGVPGPWWLLEQLGRLPAARFLRRLRVALFAGAAVPVPHAPEHEPDAQAARLVRELREAPFAPALRELSLGFVSRPRQWPACERELEALRAVAPSLASRLADVIRPGGSASVHVVRLPRGVDVVSMDVVLNPSRSDVGTATGCLVRLVGEAPLVACTFHRQSDGQWVVFDEAGDPFRGAGRKDRASRASRQALSVNGERTLRAALAPGDLVEPVEGLCLRFDLG